MFLIDGLKPMAFSIAEFCFCLYSASDFAFLSRSLSNSSNVSFENFFMLKTSPFLGKIYK